MLDMVMIGAKIQFLTIFTEYTAYMSVFSCFGLYLPCCIAKFTVPLKQISDNEKSTVFTKHGGNRMDTDFVYYFVAFRG